MKFTSLSSLLVVAVCLIGARCEDEFEVAVEEKFEAAEVAEFDDAIEVGEEVAEDSAVEVVEEAKPTWGEWFSGLIWGSSSDEAAPSEDNHDDLILDDECHDCDGDEHADHSDDAEPSSDVVTGSKRNVKKIVILTIVIVVAVIAVLALVSVYLSRRNQAPAAAKP